MILACILLLGLINLSSAETYLIPADFGLRLQDDGIIDKTSVSDNILIGHYDLDPYLDIARFGGETLEIFLFTGVGYTPEPQASRTFQQPIKSLSPGGTIWDTHPPLVVTFEDNSEKTFYLKRGCIDLNGTTSSPVKPEIPRIVSEADFQIVWESEEKPEGMHHNVVGDLDNDGINELVTWYHNNIIDDTASIQIYKCTGDNEYVLFMEEEFTTDANEASVSHFAITDIDQNGQKELVFTYDKYYFWEFSAPGVYTQWKSDFNFVRTMKEVAITDIDEDGILELASVNSYYYEQPPTAYNIREFSHKETNPDNIIHTSNLASFCVNNYDNAFAVGDFDNDGTCDIVAGNFGMVVSWDPRDVRYYRYQHGSVPTFTEEHLVTGLPISCATPVIEDMENDGENELFVAGHCPGHGSAFVWEATGFQTGYVSWVDSTSAQSGPDWCCFTIVDYSPSVVQVTTTGGSSAHTYVSLWMFQEGTYTYAWESPRLEMVIYADPNSIDMDNDGKMDLIFSESRNEKAVVWEQISAGFWENSFKTIPQEYLLHDIYPNPFNTTAVITFEISHRTDVFLIIYDITGRIVYEFARDNLPPGHYNIEWDASNLSSGIYIIKLLAGDQSQIKKAVLMK